ncbi:MAG: hypothetical protein ABIS36_23420, partial [Chryseolinea sp.]
MVHSRWVKGILNPLLVTSINNKLIIKKYTFQEEFRKLMADNDIAFDERYVWDKIHVSCGSIYFGV